MAAVLVTRDRDAARRLVDRIGVRLEARSARIGASEVVVGRPAPAAGARCVGVESVPPGRVAGSGDGRLAGAVGPLRVRVPVEPPAGQPALACVRPQSVALRAGSVSPARESGLDNFAGHVTAVMPAGARARVLADGGQPLAAFVTQRSARESRPRAGCSGDLDRRGLPGPPARARARGPGVTAPSGRGSPPGTRLPRAAIPWLTPRPDHGGDSP